MHVVVATAGHVDHGKSTLVQALTGTDPDRFAEEKRRGLTIDIGFASLALPSGTEVAFVDVPGHERFLKNMLAGVTGAAAAVFVVAATEGWKPQSEDHLRVLDLLGVAHGLVAVTKVDRVDDETRELVHLDVEDHVRGTFLSGAPVVDVAAPSGAGLASLVAALDAVVGGVPAAADRGRPRLWVDRSFTARGAGTVVTGTLLGGPLAVEEGLVVVPGGAAVRVRGLQSLHRSVGVVPPGSRVAVNVTGVGHDEVARGDVLVRPGQWRSTRVVDVSLRVLGGLGHDVTRRGAYALHAGSGEYPVVLRLIGAESLAPGASGPARLRLATPLPLLPGDRFVLRDHGRGETVAGGEVLDVAPVLRLGRASPDRSVDRVVAERGWVLADELEVLTGARREPVLGDWVASPAALQALRTGLLAKVPVAVAALDERERLLLPSLTDHVRVEGDRVVPASAPAVDLASHPFLLALQASPFSPPDPDPSARELIRAGLAVERDGVWFAATAVDEAAAVVSKLLAAHPEGVTVAVVRDALGSTRKHVLPLLAHLDATGVTRRRGDVRIGGPRLP